MTIDSRYRQTVLKNGIRIVTEAMDNVRSVSTGIWVNVGSRDETEEEGGISHLLEHMIFRGTERRNSLDIAKELDAIGGMSNAFTSREITCFYAKIIDSHLDRAVDILLDIFLNSSLDAMDVEREKQIVLQEICMIEETPEEYASQLFTQEFWYGHSLGCPIMGNADVVKSFDRSTIAAYIKKAYTPEKILVIAAGNVEHDKFVSTLRGPLSEIPEGNGRNRHKPPEHKRVVKTYQKDIEQVHICMGARCSSSIDETRYVDTILNTIVGGNMSSRLFQEIREKRGLAYTVYSYTSTYADAGMIGIYLAVNPDSVSSSVEVLLKELEKLRSGDVSTSEFDAAKEYLKGSIVLNAEGSENRMSRLARNEFCFERFIPLDEVLNKIDEVTIAQVSELAELRFDPSKLSMVAYGPTDKNLQSYS